MVKKIICSLLAVFISTLFMTAATAAPAPPSSLPIRDIFVVPTGANSEVNGNITTITKDEPSQIGSIFSTEVNKLDLTESFHAEMYVYLDNKKASAADGMIFVMHNDKDATQNFTGGVGNQLGAYAEVGGFPGLRKQLKKSFAIEFDTYHNSEDMDKGVSYNNGKGHVAYSFPDNVRSYNYIGSVVQSLIHQKVYLPSDFLSNGLWHEFIIDWDVNQQIFSYRFDSSPKVDVPIDPQAVFGGTSVYWGFTGSTGGSSQESAVAFKQIPGLVNLNNQLRVTKDGQDVIATGVKGNSGDVQVQYDAVYTGGKQPLLNPVYTLELDDNLTYTEGTLKINGASVPDSTFSGKKLTYKLPDNLSKDNSEFTVSFDATPKSAKVDNKTSIKHKIVGDNYYGNDEVSTFSVWAVKLEVAIESNSKTLNVTPADIEEFNKMTNQEILDYVILHAGISGKDITNNTSEGVSIIATDEKEFENIKNLQDGSTKLTVVAEKEGERSSPLTLSIILGEGNLMLKDVTANLEFITSKNSNSTVLIERKNPFYLIIEDTRSTGSPWKLSASSLGLAAGEKKLKGSILYNHTNKGDIRLNETPQLIENGVRASGQSTTNIGSKWTSTEGLLLEVQAGNYIGTYQGTLSWVLTDAP